MSLPVAPLAAPNLALAWKRLYAMMQPMSQQKKTKIAFYQICAMGTWPALAWFGQLTMEADYPEHVARHAYVDKTMPYMKNPMNVQYTWGTPCTLFDFECHYAHRKTILEKRAEREAAEKANH